MERIEGKTFTHNSTQYYDYTIKCKHCSYQTTLAKKIVSSGDLHRHTRNKHGITFKNNERQVMEGKCGKPRKRKTSKTAPPTINTTITTPVGLLTEAERKKLKREREADLLRRILALKDFLSLKSVPKHCWKNKYLIDAFEEDISDYSDDMPK